MAPPRLYESPLDQLTRLLVSARRDGLSFEVAWDEAIRPGRAIVMTNAERPPARAIRWPTDRTDRMAWQQAIVATREAWRRAFELEPPTYSEAALALLVEGLGALSVVAGERAAAEGIAGDLAIASAA